MPSYVRRIKFSLYGMMYFLHLNFFRYIGSPLPNPFFVILQVTKRCNLKCKHCNIHKEYESSSELSTIEIKELVDSFKSLNVKYVGITGGEPFLRKDIFDIIKYIKKKDLGCQISSNGTLITENVAKKIKRLKVDAIHISLDATLPDIHDKMRGVKGAFAKTIEGIKNLIRWKNKHTHIGVAFLLTKLNFSEILKYVDFVKRLGVDGIRIQPWETFLGYKGTKDMLSVSRGQLENLEDVIEQFIEKTKKYNIYTNSAAYLRGIKKYLQDKNKVNIKCFAGISHCLISWKGDVLPCAFMPPVGNIRNEKFEEIWISPQFNNMRKKIIENNCPKCWMSCFIEPSLRFSLKYAVKHFIQYFNDLRFYYQNSS